MIGLVLFLHYKYNNFLNCCESQVKVKERLNGRSYLEHVNANLKKKTYSLFASPQVGLTF